MSLKLALLLSIALASPALAQDAAAPAAGTVDGARALSSDLAAYFGQPAFDKKAVEVTPEPAGYRIMFRLGDFKDALKDLGAKIEASPLSFLVSRRGDGNWDVSGSDPFSFAFDVGADATRQQAEYKIGRGSFSGVFSPAVGTFLSGSGSYDGGSMTSSDAMSKVAATFGAMNYTIDGKDVGGGKADLTSRQSIADLRETVTLSGAEFGSDQPVTVTVSSSRIGVDGVMTGLTSRSMMDIWAFLVAHSDKQKILADQDGLKTLLKAALPLWDRLDGGYDFEKVSIEMPLGRVDLASMSLDFVGDGISKSSDFAYGIGFKGLEVQSAMLPAWSVGLLPQEFEIRAKAVGLDLETPARLAIDDLDLARAEPFSAEASAKIAAGFSDNPPRLLIEPSHIKSRDLDVTMQGEFRFAGAQPEMTMNIEAAGLDKAMATLRESAASDPSINEVVGGLAIAQGFAKPLPNGRSQWVIETKADGSMMLNGNQLVAPTPAEVPGDAPTDENAQPDALQ